MIQGNKNWMSSDCSGEGEQLLRLIGDQMQTHISCYSYFTVVNFIVQSTGNDGGIIFLKLELDWYCSGGGTIPCYPSWVLVPILVIKFTQDTLTGENFMCMRDHKMMLREWYEIGRFFIFLCKETIHLWAFDKTKRLRFEALINKEIKQSLGLGSKVLKKEQGLCIWACQPWNELSLVIRMSLLASSYWEGTLHKGELSSVFRETKKDQRVHICSAFQVILIRNNQYAALASLGADLCALNSNLLSPLCPSVPGSWGTGNTEEPALVPDLHDGMLVGWLQVRRHGAQPRVWQEHSWGSYCTSN